MPSVLGVQPGQVVEVDGLPYLVLGKTQTEYDVGDKVLVDCEDLTVDPASMTVAVKGLEVAGRGNGHRVDSLVGLLGMPEEDVKSHSRSHCMRCKAPPAIEVHWANGHGRAWFCQKCFRPWLKEVGDWAEIIRAWYLPNGEVGKEFGGNGTVQIRRIGEGISSSQIADRLDRLIAQSEQGEKAGSGRWRTLKDGRHVLVTAPKSSVIRGGISGKQADKLWEQIDSWKGARKDIAQSALDLAEVGEDLYVLTDGGEGDELVSVMAVSQPKKVFGFPPFEKYREVGALATSRKGYGRRAMQQLVEDCAKEGRDGVGIVLMSTKASSGFYERLGMNPLAGNLYYWSPGEVKEQAGQKDIGRGEPDDGIFVVPRKDRKKPLRVKVPKSPGKRGEDEKSYTSVIVALVPHLPISTRLAQKVKGALPVADLHVTLCHLGKTRSLAQHRLVIEDALEEIAAICPPIRYKVGGHGRFLGVTDDGKEGGLAKPLDAVYASVDSPQLPELHRQLVQALEAVGVEVSKDHGFTPHITLAYTDDKEWMPDLQPLYGVVDRLVLCWGDEQKGFQLRGPVGYVRKRQQEKAMPHTLVSTKKGRWVTVHGRPIFIAKARGTKPSAGGATRFDKDRWGAMSVADRRDKWEALSESQRDDIADAANSVPEYQASLVSHAGARPDLSGDDVSGAIDARLSSLMTKDGEDYVPEQDAKLISSTVHDFDNVLKEAGLTPAQRYQLTMEAADALVAQDRESMGRTLGDHGIYHIKGNIDNTMGILEAHPDADPAEARAAAYIANIFHDTGYMAPPAQMFLDAGHPRWSQQHYDENLRPMVKEAFGGRFAGNVSHLIRTHAATNIDWSDDVLGSAVRVADNVALFQSQKLPALFRHVPGATNVLEQLSAGRINAGQAHSQLSTLLGKTGLSKSVKTQLAKGIPEVGSLTGKFTLGMLGGDILGFGWSNNALTIRLGRNADADRLQRILDLGQRQFAKFAKTYGVDPKAFTESLQFEFKGPGGNTLLRSTIEEMKALLKRLEDTKAKGRWRTTRDGRHILVSGPIRSGVTIAGGRTRLTIKGDVKQSKVDQAVEAFEALPAWQRRNVKALVLDAEKGYGTTVGGQAYTAGGEFTPNREVVIYNANKADKREMARRISHEAGHGAFRDLGAQRTDAEFRVRQEHPDWMTPPSLTAPPQLKPEFVDRARQEYPALGAYTRLQQTFRRQDGVTPYSKQWTRQEGRESTLALNETFAELSEMYTTSVQRNGVRAARSLLPSQAGARDVAQAFLDVVDILDRGRGGKGLDVKAKGNVQGKRVARATFDDNWEPVPPGPRATHLVEIETNKDGTVRRITYFDAVPSGEKACHWHDLSDTRRVVIVPLGSG